MAGKNSPGPKLKLTDDLIAKAVKHLKAGNYVGVVIQYLGIDNTTYYFWLQRAREELEMREKHPDLADPACDIYIRFAKETREAEAEAELRNITLIQQAAQDTWQAAAWYLERKHGVRWALKKQVELTGKDGEPIRTESKVDIPQLDDKRVKQAFEVLYNIQETDDDDDI